MTGRQVDAVEALAIGLADKVAPDDEVLELALNDAQRFANGPTQAYAAVKTAVREGYDIPLVDAIAIESEQFTRTFRSQDARIGVAHSLRVRAAARPGREPRDRQRLPVLVGWARAARR